MIVAFTIVPVPTLKPLDCSTSPTLANRCSPNLLSLSGRRNFSSVVPSGTRSHPSSMPTKRRKLALSSSASSQASSARLNQCCMKCMRNMRSKPIGGLPLPALGQCGSITSHNAQWRPRNDLVHRSQEPIALGELAVTLEPSALIGRHYKGLLLHLTAMLESTWRWTLVQRCSNSINGKFPAFCWLGYIE
jgi:hypothetical protein